MFDKTKSCKGCPDRSAEPNCHTDCEGYLVRQQNKPRFSEADQYCKERTRKIKDAWVKTKQERRRK